MNQVQAVSYDEVLNAVRQWPTTQRFHLVQEVLKTLEPATMRIERPQRKEKTLDRALGLVNLNGPAPTDEEVKQWLDEHRMEKYG